MTIVTRTTTLNAQPHDVWRVLADFGTISRWAPNVDHSCLLAEQQSGIGTSRRIQAGRTTLVESVTEWTPPVDDTPGALAYTLEGLPKVVRSVTNRWQLTPTGTGTAVTLTSTVDAGSRLPQKAIAWVVARKLASASDEMIAGLTSHLADPTADTESHP